MNKKEFLISKGYKYNAEANFFTKVIDNFKYFSFISLEKKTYWLQTSFLGISRQEHIDRLQSAFDELKNNYEESIKYEN